MVLTSINCHLYLHAARKKIRQVIPGAHERRYAAAKFKLCALSMHLNFYVLLKKLKNIKNIKKKGLK